MKSQWKWFIHFIPNSQGKYNNVCALSITISNLVIRLNLSNVIDYYFCCSWTIKISTTTSISFYFLRSYKTIFVLFSYSAGNFNHYKRIDVRGQFLIGVLKRTFLYFFVTILKFDNWTRDKVSEMFVPDFASRTWFIIILNC